jgi:ferredoxin
MKYLIKINELACIGCGICEHRFPHLFRVGQHAASYTGPPFTSIPDEVTLQRLRELAENCPAAAIILPDAFLEEPQ